MEIHLFVVLLSKRPVLSQTFYVEQCYYVKICLLLLYYIVIGIFQTVVRDYQCARGKRRQSYGALFGLLWMRYIYF